MRARILATRPYAPMIWEVTLGIDQAPPPPPGAHVTVHLPSTRRRTYSICGRGPAADRYRLLVRLSGQAGSGGEELKGLRPGTELEVDAPRSDFPCPIGAASVAVIGGGIGMTPLVSIAAAARAHAIPTRALLIFRTSDDAVLADEFADVLSEDGPAVVLGGRAGGAGRALAEFVSSLPPGTRIFCCGPWGMDEAVRGLAAAAKRGLVVHTESFGAAPASGGNRSFLLQVDGDDRWLEVPANRSILETLREAGHPMPSNCGRGQCGTCMAWVVEGRPEHRDTYLMPGARAANQMILTCVSRSLTDRLVIAI